MNKFKDFPYARPDFDKEKEALRQYAADIKAAESYEELRRIFLQREQEAQQFGMMFDLAYIRNTIDTRNPFYDAEMTAFYQEEGPLALLRQEAAKALLSSPFLSEFQEEFGSLVVKDMEVSLKLASPEVVEDMEKDSTLCQKFNRITSTCSTVFEGEECSFNGLLKHMQSPDRAHRQAAFLAWSDLYQSISGELDALYDEMVSVRRNMAKKLGYDSFVSLIYDRMGHYDYKPEDVAVFRKQVLEYVTPLCERLFAKQAQKLGVDKLEWFDEALSSPDGNAVPQGTKEEMIAAAQEMYHELSPETREFIDFMVEHQLFDLESKPGKQPGGYCSFLNVPKAPFIFANFNGTSADVDVLTHEAGHAFESYVSSRTNPLSSQVFATSEVSEIHSMSMEFFTYPWMEKFFGSREKADQYRQDHLETALKVVPYMVCVDEFQHRVFAENLDAAGRRRVWRELEHTYMPWRSYAGSDFLESGGFWMQKLHIFINPFYYIDYALAQMGAFEFYQKMSENREKAWADYYRLCQSGGRRGYFDTLSFAGLSNPLREGTVQKIMAFVESRLF